MDDTEFPEEKTKGEGEGGFFRRFSKRWSKRGKKRDVEHKFEEITRPAGYEHEDLHTIMKRLKKEIDTLKHMHKDWEQPAKRSKLDHDFREIAGHVYQYGNMIASRVGIPTVQKSVTDRYDMEIRDLKEEIKSLRNSRQNDRRLADKDTEISRLKREIQTLNGELKVKRSSESDQQTNGEYENRRHSRGRLPRKDENGVPDTSKYVIHELQDTIEKCKIKLKEYEEEIERIKLENESLKDDLYNSKDDNKELSKRSGSAVKEVESQRHQIENLIKSCADKDESLARLNKEIEKQRGEIQQFSRGHQKSSQGLDQGLKEKVESLSKRCHEQGSAIRTHEETIEKLRRQFQMEKKAKEEALSRLSSIASRNMSNNNPGITDLSDPDRPLKLVEKFAEVYDNEWTNAMENLEDLGKQEKEGLTILLKILVRIYELCKRASIIQLSSIPIYLSIPFIEDGDISNMKFRSSEEIPDDIKKGLKVFRKSNVDQALPHIKTIIKDKLRQENLADVKILRASEEFIDSVVRLCWLMVVHDPPIHMEWDFKPGCSFDNTIMRSYTSCGDVMEYVVWPVLYLHENGPLLSKGVMQGCKNPPGESSV